MNEFLKECKPGKMRKWDLAALIHEYESEITDFVIKKGHLQKTKDTMDKLYKKMVSPKFAKAMKAMVKDDDYKPELGMAVVIGTFLERNHDNEELTDDTKAVYSSIIDRLLKARIKEIHKKCPSIDEAVLKELLIIAPSHDYITNDRFVGVYSQRMLRKLYALANTVDIGFESTKTIKKLFSAIFGKNLIDLIAVNILLEKKEYSKNLSEKAGAVWSLMTTFALDTIESQDKDHIKELLDYYCKRRGNDAKNQRDAARRLVFTGIAEDSYPKTLKVATKMAKNDNYKKYL